jgi:hypothetical protein
VVVSTRVSVYQYGHVTGAAKQTDRCMRFGCVHHEWRGGPGPETVWAEQWPAWCVVCCSIIIVVAFEHIVSCSVSPLHHMKEFIYE